MFKPCPKCGFLVALIAGREASQRCPRCGSVLVSESELLELEAAGPHPGGHARDDRGAPQQAHDVASADRARASASVEPPVPQVSAVDVRDPDGDVDRADVEHGVASANPGTTAAAHEGPSFARRRDRVRNARPRWPWIIGLAALSLLLALQLLLAQRAELSRDAAWRPLVMRACGLLRCTVPAWHEPQAFAMLARGVRPSGTRGVLHVNATVRNDARWPQAPPVVVLSLSDVDGRVVGARAVTPAEYGHRGDTGIAPGDSVDIAFDVREPTAHVESFDFQLQ